MRSAFPTLPSAALLVLLCSREASALTASTSLRPHVTPRVSAPRLFIWEPPTVTATPPTANDFLYGSSLWDWAKPRTEEEAEAETGEDLLPWQLTLLGVTACWGANFAVTKYALNALGGTPADGELFVASRFVVAAVMLVPFLASASSTAAVVAGAQVGGLCAFGYASQAMALGMGASPGTTAFICSLQSVVVALMAARASGVKPQTWLAVALSVAGVGCLELPSVLSSGAAEAGAAAVAAAGPMPCVGDLLAFGQPVGFGLSYVVLEQAMEAHPEDELPLSALQCLVIAAAALGAASVGMHSLPWDLPWDHLMPSAATAVVPSAPWGVPLAIAYTGVISTALTIWITAKVFKRLPSTDASIILASEPLWATGFAAMLLREPLTPSIAVGGVLILAALAANEGALDALLPDAMLGGESAREEEQPQR